MPATRHQHHRHPLNWQRKGAKEHLGSREGDRVKTHSSKYSKFEKPQAPMVTGKLYLEGEGVGLSSPPTHSQTHRHTVLFPPPKTEG